MCDHRLYMAIRATAVGMHQPNEDWKLGHDMVFWFTCSKKCVLVFLEGSQKESHELVLHCVCHADSNGKICSLNLFSKGGGAQCWLKVDQFPGAGGTYQHTEKQPSVEGGHWEVVDISQHFPHQATQKLNINTHYTCLLPSPTCTFDRSREVYP